MDLHCFLSCEHGGNRIPEEYAHLFVNAETVLASHRGWDKGTLDLFTIFSTLQCFRHVQYATVSRLLVDLNRSISSRNLFSAYTRELDKKKKAAIVASYYHPYHERFRQAVKNTVDSGRQALHLSLHSFTPVLNGTVREGEIGILYDPAHGREKIFTTHWLHTIRRELPGLRVRANYPYTGKADGLTRILRRLFANDYMGIELEVNQNIIDDTSLQHTLASTFSNSLESFQER